jgi:hypothetical protein
MEGVNERRISGVDETGSIGGGSKLLAYLKSLEMIQLMLIDQGYEYGMGR